MILTESTKLSLLMRYGSYDPARVVTKVKLKPRHKWSCDEFHFVSQFELNQRIQDCKLYLKPENQIKDKDTQQQAEPKQSIKEISPPRKGDLIHAPERKNKNGVILWASVKEDSAGIKFFGGDVEELFLSQFEEWTLVGGRKVWELDE